MRTANLQQRIKGWVGRVHIEHLSAQAQAQAKARVG
jgi:hypothetical protein